MLLSILIGAAVLLLFMAVIPSGTKTGSSSQEAMFLLNQQNQSQMMKDHIFNSKFGVYDSSRHASSYEQEK